MTLGERLLTPEKENICSFKANLDKVIGSLQYNTKNILTYGKLWANCEASYESINWHVVTEHAKKYYKEDPTEHSYKEMIEDDTPVISVILF